MNIRFLLIVLILLVVGLAVYAFTRPNDAEAPTEPAPLTFEECAARYPVMESFPRQCVTPEGVRFVEEVAAPAPAPAAPGIANLIIVSAPGSGATVASPLTITGEARGTWYFEATFPLELRNANGELIAQHYAEAQSDWMTENFVPFRASLTFPTQPTGSTGTLILRNSNASGDPVRDRSVTIPVRF